MKTKTNLSIEQDVVERAKKAGLNMSAELERSLRDRLSTPIDNSPEEIKVCERCNRELDKATKDTANDLNKLTWLYPDEVWVCNRCLNKIFRSIL